MNDKYLILKVEKPLKANSRVFGKFVSIKKWVQQRFSQNSEPVFVEISKKTFIFEKENYFLVFSRGKADFAKTIKKFMEQENV